MSSHFLGLALVNSKVKAGKGHFGFSICLLRTLVLQLQTPFDVSSRCLWGRGIYHFWPCLLGKGTCGPERGLCQWTSSWTCSILIVEEPKHLPVRGPVPGWVPQKPTCGGQWAFPRGCSSSLSISQHCCQNHKLGIMTSACSLLSDPNWVK